MKILLINKYDNTGGAAIACRRLLFALLDRGHNAQMLVQERKLDIPQIISLGEHKWQLLKNFSAFALERAFFTLHERDKQVRFLFSPANTGQNIATHPLVKEADIIHLHWTNFGVLSLNGLQKLFNLGKPVVWTLHDMWAFTGGCHHSGECLAYERQCGNCHFLRKPAANDLSHKVWEKKNKVLNSANLSVVTCSQWLGKKAASSALFRNIPVNSIPNPIDTQTFAPKNKIAIREKLGLNPTKKYILYGAVKNTNYFKGYSFFVESLNVLRKKYPDLHNELEIIMIGYSLPEDIANIPFKVNDMGLIREESSMTEIYNAASVFVTASLQENLPNTIMESFSCGVPAIAYNVGGIPEMIDHEQNGYLAQYKNANDMAQGIYWLLYKSNYNALSENARNKVLSMYSYQAVSEKYEGIYNGLIQ